MDWGTAGLALVGAWGIVGGVIHLGRTVRTALGDAGTDPADTDSVTVETAGQVLLGVALVVTGSSILYIALVLGGFLASW